MLALLTALVLAQAGDCAIALEPLAREGATRLRPACPVSRQRTHEAVAQVFSKAESGEVRLAFGRLVDYPWLSALLARQASASRHWDPQAGRDNQYVASALRGMPEFTALFPTGWQIAGVSVEKVLRKPAAELPLAQGAPTPPKALLPYDAIVWVTLRKP
jgi:hypothetical protein